MSNTSSILRINRDRPFNPAHIPGLDKRCRPVEQDERSLRLTEIDVSMIRLETTAEEGEKVLCRVEKIRRLKLRGFICLDVAWLLAFWENPEFIPSEWDNFPEIDFDGTVFWQGSKCCATSLRKADRKWHRDLSPLCRDCVRLGPECKVIRPSAVLCAS